MASPSRIARRIAVLSVFLCGIFLSSGLAGASMAATPQSPGTIGSINWAGYALTVTSVSYHFQSVSASWVVPKFVGSCSATAANQTVQFFVAMDGISPSTTLEAMGTQMSCNLGRVSYHPFWWYAPAKEKFWGWTLHPGDSVTAIVTHAGSGFNGTVTDTTTGAWGWASRHLPAGKAAHVEWIVGRPLYGTSSWHKLPNFGHVIFKNCQFKIGGVTSKLSSGLFTSPTFAMYNKAGSSALVSVGSVYSGTKFASYWLRAGP